MEGGRRIYTRRQWDNFYREWNVEKKRKLNKNCKYKSSGFSGNGSSELDGNGDSSDVVVPGDGSTSRMVGKIVGKKAAVGGNSGNDDNFPFTEELEKKKKKRRNAGRETNDHGDYIELLIESADPHLDSAGKVVKAVDNNRKGKGKEKFVSGAGNVGSKDEDEDGDESCSSLLDEKNSYFDNEYIDFLDESKKDHGDYTELLDESEKVIQEVEKSRKDKGKEKIVSDAGNVSSEEEDEDKDETLTVGEEEFALQSILSEKTDNQVEESSKKVKENAVSADNFSTDGGEPPGSPLNEKDPDYDDDYTEFLEEYLAFLAHRREMSENGVERNNGEVEDKKSGSDIGNASEKKDSDDCSESFALSSDSIEELEKWAEKKKKMNRKRKGKMKLEIPDDNVSPKVEGENDDYIKDSEHHQGPAYHLRSRSVSKCEMKENELRNVRNPLPASKEDLGSEPSSDEDKKNDTRMKNHVSKDKKKVDHPNKRRKSKHGLGDLNFKKILLNSISENVDVTKNNLQFCKENIPEELPLKFQFEDKDPAPPEKNEWEKEIDSLFVDLQTGLQELKDSLTTQPLVGSYGDSLAFLKLCFIDPPTMFNF